MLVASENSVLSMQFNTYPPYLR